MGVDPKPRRGRPEHESIEQPADEDTPPESSHEGSLGPRRAESSETVVGPVEDEEPELRGAG
jgi:hypothetical protein